LILDFSLEFWKRGEGTEKGEESIPKWRKEKGGRLSSWWIVTHHVGAQVLPVQRQVSPDIGGPADTHMTPILMSVYTSASFYSPPLQYSSSFLLPNRTFSYKSSFLLFLGDWGHWRVIWSSRCSAAPFLLPEGGARPGGGHY
jgi:hypothetical protein